jgi:hypothetical protein
MANDVFGGLSGALNDAATKNLAESQPSAYSAANGQKAKALAAKNKISAESTRQELIRQITDNQRVAVGKLAEAQSYAPARQLFIDPSLGLGVPVDNVVVDAPVPFGRERPDIQIWLEGVPVQTRNEGEHLYAILELKTGSKVRTGGRAIAKDELATYSYRKLRHFYLADAEVVQRYDLDGEGLPQAREVRWVDLAPDDAFIDFFAPLSPVARTLKAQLTRFASVDIPPGRIIAAGDTADRKRFIDAVVTTARLLSSAVRNMVSARLVPDLVAVRQTLAEMQADFGTATIDFAADEPFTFADEPPASDQAAHASFNERYTQFMAAVEDKLYALRAETDDLPAYAERSGLKREHATFIVPDGASKEAKGTALSARASYVQETATLLFSRLLMIRFSEDHGLLPRILSNGGLPRYASFASQTGDRFQRLVTIAYDRARPIYRHLFEERPVDWLLHEDDETLSDALLHAMWILSGWDFTSVRGDVMSGIYDRNLDATQRRALGEVYTRPELARYMLQACGYDGTQSLLDPACGSGTFLVEGLEIMRRRKEAAGLAVTGDDVVETLSDLHGMDLNGFSATLAQIQLLWHALLASDADPMNTMRRAITALSVEGGHSSLETWGTSIVATDLFGGDAGSVSEVAKAVGQAVTRRMRNADRRFRDLASRQESYRTIAGNPPYVRVHRLRLSAAQETEYAPVRRKQTDLSVLFTYRALEWWLEPGGRLGFYLPIALAESAYAEPLRAIVDRYRIVEIIDLEEIGNVAFHGANVVTMGLVVEKTPAAATDLVRITRVTPECYDGKIIDMTKAVSEEVPIGAIQLARYLPVKVPAASSQATDATTDADEDEDEDSGGTSDTAWLTKVRPDDVPILDKLAASRRLDEIVLRGWKSIGKGAKRFAPSIPAGEPAYRWKQVRVMGYGVKLGGKFKPTPTGLPVFKVKSLAPSGQIDADAEGLWDGSAAQVDTVRFYSWKDVGDKANTFAIRNIATQAVFAPHPVDAYLTNTVYIMRLSERFPLNVWSISRVIAWFMALTARTSVIQGYFATFYQRHTTRMPIPSTITPELLAELSDVGSRIFAADDELAKGDEDIARLRAGIDGSPLRNRLNLLESSGITKPADVSWPSSEADWSGVTVISDERGVTFVLETDGETGPAPTPSGKPCRIDVVDPDLRAWVLAEAQRRVADGRLPDRAWLQSMPIPDDLSAALNVLNRWRDASAADDLQNAIHDLDVIVGKTLALSEDDLKHIDDAFESDDLLRHTRPQWRHRADRAERV